jgi:hypothetical protein
MKDVHSWVEPLRIAALRLIEFLDVLLKYGENAASRIADLEPVSERVREKIALRAFLVRLQGIIENQLEVGRCGSSVSVRHKGDARIEGGMVESWVTGKEKSNTPHKRTGILYSIYNRWAP